MKVRIIHFQNRATHMEKMEAPNLEQAICAYSMATGHKLKENPVWVHPDNPKDDIYQMKAMAEDGVITAQASHHQY